MPNFSTFEPDYFLGQGHNVQGIIRGTLIQRDNDLSGPIRGIATTLQPASAHGLVSRIHSESARYGARRAQHASEVGVVSVDD